MQKPKEQRKVRSSHHVIYEHLREQLESQGYSTWRIFCNRWAVYVILIIAINQLAWLTKRNPYRVYQVLYVIYRNAMRGACFRPARLTKVQLELLGEEERRGCVTEYCPHCGGDIGAAGKVSAEEFDGRRKQFPTKSTTNVQV